MRSHEQQVAELRERTTLAAADSAAVRVPAAGAGHDVSEVRAELRADMRVLAALRETQLEVQGSLREVRGSLTEVQGAVVENGVRLTRLDVDVRTGFATMGAGMAAITSLLGSAGPT